MENKEFLNVGADETRELVETLRGLPEDYRKTLYGAAVGLKLALDLEKLPPKMFAAI